MAKKSPTLSIKAHRALAALLTANSVEEAAQQAGVGARTLHRWLADDQPFQEAYRLHRRQILAQAHARLQQASGRAVSTLLAILDDPNVYAAIRVTAAKTILEIGVRVLELEDLEQRITRLEQPYPLAPGGPSNGAHTVDYTG